jgi:NAD(P)H dehydrogenase (quinone)
MTKPTVLVTGASGHLGSLVIETLLDAGTTNIIATTRHPDKLAAFAARGVDVRAADFDKPEGLAAAFAGAERLLLISTDSLAVPGQRVTQHRAAIDAAKAAGVGHIVYLSAPSPRPTPEPTLISDHYWTEQAVVESGLDFTFLRDHLYTDLLLASLPHAVASGQVYSATAGRGRSFVTRDDCARSAAGALAGATTGKTILDITGPEPLTFDALAALVSELTGKPVKHIAVDPASYKGGLTAAGLPPFLVEGLADFDSDAAQGFHAITTTAVKDLSGQEPTTVREFLSANLAALSAGH